VRACDVGFNKEQRRELERGADVRAIESFFSFRDCMKLNGSALN